MSLTGKRRPVRQTILGLFGFFVLAVVLLGSVFISLAVYRIEGDIWRERRADGAQNAADTVANFLDRIQRLLLFSARDLEYEPERDQAELRLLLLADSAIEEVVQVTPEGRVIQSASRGETILGNSFAVRQSYWFSQVKREAYYLGSVEYAADGRPYVIMAVASPAGDILTARIRMEVLSVVVEHIRFGNSGRIYVIDQNGYLLAHPNPAVMLGYTNVRDRSELAAVLAVGGQRWEDHYINFEQRVVLGTVQPIAGTGWQVLAEVDVAETYAYSRIIWLVQAVGIVIFGAVSMFFASRLLDSWIFVPLNRLRNGAEEIQTGKLDVRVPVARVDEIGDVSHAFNLMAAALHEHEESLVEQSEKLRREVLERQAAQAELERLNRELEDRVSLRTAELSQANQRLVESEARFHGLVENIPAVTYLAELRDEGPALSYVSPQIDEMLGFSPAEWLQPERWLRQIHPEDYPILEEYYNHVVWTAERFSLEYRLLAKDGHTVWIRDQGVVQALSGGNRLVQGVMSDITLMHQKAEELAWLALHDGLTGLPNRGLFLERLGHIMMRAERHSEINYAVLFIDLDGFKTVNDTYGHAWGDRVLVETAARLMASVRDFDTVARLGGDEFVILIEDPRDRNAVETMQRRIEEAICRPYLVSETEVRLGVSIGMSCCEEMHLNPEAMIHAADLAMYREKMRHKSGSHPAI